MMLPAAQSKTFTPRQQADEKRRRQAARKNLLDFCQYIDERYQTPPHIRLVASKLQEVALYIATRGKKGINRLMIEMPPQHGKSELVSRRFPAWLLGLLPDSRIILTSYGADLATKHSRVVRDTLESKKYQAVFGALSIKADAPVELSSDSRSVQSWDLAQPYRGGMLAIGVGGGATGNPADVFIIDDPFKNREEAESESRRELVDDFYKSSAKTRLSPWGAIVIFHTRWHPDDQAGKLIRRMVSGDDLADQWEVVFLPALALDSYAANAEEQEKHMRDGVFLPLSDQLGREPGQALWPERYSREWLLSQQANIGTYDFEALYQQLPFAKDGQRYKREWFKFVTQLPEGVTLKYIVRYWDKANSPKGDYSAGVCEAYGSDGNFYFLDVTRKQCTSYERDRMMVKTAQDDRLWGKVNLWHQQDPGSAGKDSAEATNRVLALEGFAPHFEPVTGSKETRSEPLESAFEGGMVYLLKGAWNQAFIEECIAFPNGRYDDQVDAASSAHTKLLQIIGRRRESRIL